MVSSTQRMCPDCKGFGWNAEHTRVCPTCDGTGYVDKEYMEPWQRSLLDQRRERLVTAVRAVIARGAMAEIIKAIFVKDVTVLA